MSDELIAESFLCGQHRVVRKRGSLWKGDDAKKYKYAGVLPECVNIGCSAIVALRHITQSGTYSFYTECSNCKTLRGRGEKLSVKGVIQWKKDYCENVDGVLGFVCPVRIGDLVIPDVTEETIRTLWGSCLQFDHIDGNSHNNVPENVMTLCSVCHLIKTRTSGDTLRDGYRVADNGRVGEEKRALGEIRLPGAGVVPVSNTLEKFYEGGEDGNE
jgi:5-methylcytosine-specific restriction endonuclease McrA